MLKPAQLYKEELEKLFLRTWYDPKYMFYSGWTGNEQLTIPDNNYNAHHFASAGVLDLCWKDCQCTDKM